MGDSSKSSSHFKFNKEEEVAASFSSELLTDRLRNDLGPFLRVNVLSEITLRKVWLLEESEFKLEVDDEVCSLIAFCALDEVESWLVVVSGSAQICASDSITGEVFSKLLKGPTRRRFTGDS